MAEKRFSLRQGAKEIGISHTTLERVMAGDGFTIESLLALSRWLGISAADALEVADKDDSSAKLQVLLQYYPKLTSVFTQAVDLIAQGKLDPGVLNELANYAEFRIKEKGEDKA